MATDGHGGSKPATTGLKPPCLPLSLRRLCVKHGATVVQVVVAAVRFGGTKKKKRGQLKDENTQRAMDDTNESVLHKGQDEKR